MPVEQYGPWNAKDLFDICYKNKKLVDRPLSFLNVLIKNKLINDNTDRNKRINLQRSNLIGAGIYTLYFRECLIYIGSYFPKSGDIRSKRWTHHLATVTMRSYLIHLKEKLWTDVHKTGKICGHSCNKDFLLEFRNGLEISDQKQKRNRQDELYKLGRGNRTSAQKDEYKKLNKLCISRIGDAPDVSKKRMLFANMFWDDFKPVPNETTDRITNIFSDFDFYYVRDTDSPENVNCIYKNNETYRNYIKKNVETESVKIFNPIINNESELELAKLEANYNEVQQSIMNLFETVLT